MNNFLSTLILLCTLASLDVKAQSDDHNYIVKSSILDEQGLNSVVSAEYYDGLGRKEQVITNEVKPGNASEALLSRTIYDDRGNITRLQRTGFPDEHEQTTILDDLDMSYNGNQLSEVEDNANGGMETDVNNDIVFMEYDNCGYAKGIYFKNGSSIKYVHTPTGEKLKETYTTAVPNVTKPVGLPFSLAPPEIQSVITKDYWGTNIICKNGEPQQFFFDGGFADIKDSDLTWHYYVKDHLGSNRIVQDEQGKMK